MHENGFWDLLKINYTKHTLLLLHKEVSEKVCGSSCSTVLFTFLP